MATLAVRLSTREGRLGLAAAYASAAKLLPAVTEPAALLSDMVAWSPTRLDEVGRVNSWAGVAELVAEGISGIVAVVVAKAVAEDTSWRKLFL